MENKVIHELLRDLVGTAKVGKKTDEIIAKIENLNRRDIKYRLVIETETENGEKSSWTAFVASYEDIVDIMNGIGMYGNFPTVSYKVDKLEIDDPISVVRAICDKYICRDTDIWL